MRKIRVVSRKYNGSLRDENPAFLFAETSEMLVVYTPPGTLAFDHRKGTWLEAPDGVLELYFKSRWYTVWHICEQNSFVNAIYTHISMPAVLTGDILTWVDLDLDYRVHLDGSIERLDEDEFEQNSRAMRYAPQVIAAAQAACAEVEHLYRERVFPFNHQEQVDLYWRIRQELGGVSGAAV